MADVVAPTIASIEKFFRKIFDESEIQYLTIQ